MKKKNIEITNERIKTNLTTQDFFYNLPEELIAQSPSERRDGCRMMVLDKSSGKTEHKIFSDIIDYLNPEDMLVVNSSKVIPARLMGVAEKTGSPIELLLLRVRENDLWETLVRPGKRAKIGASFSFSGVLRASVTDILDGGNRIVKFEYDR
ncbi:MAG: S-adenosylmethionine:tRNA ribosyltransferase-isomerase, partial [Clostridia bacterium]|nr:S-adenosylmethionine:tRNA ribosyltransferase-isomerase [Clostridia bacterium]